MGSYSSDNHTFIPTGASRVPLAISPLRHKTPSLPVMRHSPSVQTLNFHPLGLQPLNSFRAKLHSRPGTESIIEDADATPRPLRIKKIRKSPSVPFGGMQDFKPPPKPTRHGPPPSRNFLGLSFPPQPKPRSSSAGVLSIDKTGGAGMSLTNGFKADTIRRASSHRQSERKELPGAGMAWLQRAKTVRPMSTLSPPDTNKTLDDTQNAASLSTLPGQEDNRKSSYQVSKSRDSSGDATAGSSFRSSSYQSLDDEPRTPKAHDGNVSKRVKERNSKTRRVASASEPHEDGEKNGLDYKDSKVSKEYTPKGPVDKITTRGWKEKMFSRDFFTRGGGSTSPKKDAKVKGRERTYSTSSATIVKTVHLPRPLTAIGHPTPLRVDIPSNHSWCEHSSRQSRREAWQLDGHAAASSLAGSGIRSRTNFNDSVLGIFEGNIGGMGRTRLKKTGQWKPPILRLEMAVVAETEKVPITYHGGDGNDKVVWVSVELDGAVDKGTDCFEGSKVGLDVAVLMDISAYTSSTSFVNMKLQAKRIVEAMETSRDRVAVMTFPVASSNTEPIPVRRDAIHVLNSSGSVAKKQLMDDITSLVQNKWDMDPASRNVREAVLASVRKLKGMPRDTARYGTHRHGHLFLLTTKLDAGEIELLPEVFFGEIQIHIIGIGALFWPRNEMGASGWCMPTGTLGPRPILPKATINKRDDSVAKSEKEELGIEEIIQLLRMAVDLGALYDLNIELRAGEHCSIRAVMGDLKYSRILPGEKRSILIQVQVGDMPTPDSGYDLDGHNEVIPRWVILERQLEATLGELKGRLLSVKSTYGHSNFSGDTLFSTEKHLDISRFAEDSLWRFSPTGNKLVNKEKSPPLTPIIAEDYVKKVLIQRVASMHSSPSRALRAVQEIANNTICRVTSFDEISRELVYRDKVEQKFRATRSSYSQSSNEELLIDLIDRSNDRTPTPRNSLEGAEIIMNSTPPPISTLVLEAAQMTPTNRDCRYRGSRELHNEDRAPFIATMDSSPDTERPDIDPEDEAQRIWQEIKLRQRGVSSGSIKRRSVRSNKVASFYGLEQLKDKYSDQENGDMLSTVYSSSSAFGQESEVEGERYRGVKGDREIRCHSGQEALDSLVTLRDIRETDFGPWAL